MSQTPPEREIPADAPVTAGRDAAQGRTGSRTFIILVISIGLVVIAFVAIYALRAPGLTKHGGYGGQTGVKGAAGESFHAPAEAAPKQNAPTNATTPGTH